MINVRPDKGTRTQGSFHRVGVQRCSMSITSLVSDGDLKIWILLVIDLLSVALVRANEALLFFGTNVT